MLHHGNDYQFFAIIYGFIDRYADYYDFYSGMQDCKRNLLEYRSREAQFFENFEGKYRYGDNTDKDFVDLQGIFLGHAMKMAHPITHSCLYAF